VVLAALVSQAQHSRSPILERFEAAPAALPVLAAPSVMAELAVMVEQVVLAGPTWRRAMAVMVGKAELAVMVV